MTLSGRSADRRGSSPVLRLPRAVSDHPWILLTGWAFLAAAVHLPAHGWGWHYFVTGVHALVSPTPLAVYADHPELQIGPLALAVAVPFVLVGHGVVGELAAMGLMTLLGLVVVRGIVALTGADREHPDTPTLAVAALVLAVWSEVAVHWTHLDDALALAAAVTGLRLVRSGRPLAAAAVLGLGIDAKPWALPFAAVLLLAPRARLAPAIGVLVAVVCAAWLPFVVGEPQTVAALRFGIPVDPASTLHLVDAAARTTPRWDRAVQAGVAIAFSVVALTRRRWPTVILSVVAIRLLLDPATKDYYDAGLVTGTALVDLVAATGALPWLTLVALTTVYLPSYALAGEPPARAVLRTLGLAALLAAVSLVPLRRPAVSPAPPGSAAPAAPTAPAA